MTLRSVLTTEAARPRGLVNRPYAPWLAVATVCFGAFLGQLDASIVTLTFPALRAEFGASLAAVQWVSLSYLLALVTLLTPLGRVADRLGRKQCYLYGFLLFLIGSAACGLAPSLALLIVFRVVQAVGAGLLQSNSVALVTTSVVREKRRTALGIQAAAQALGLALGPLVGGALVAGLGWRWVFFSTVPVGVLGLVAGYFLLPRTRIRSSSGRFDAVGPLALMLGSGAVLLGLSAVSGLPVSTLTSALLLAGGVVLLGVFGWWQLRSSAPLIPPCLVRSRAVVAGLVAALFGYLVLFGPLVLVPVVLTDRYGTLVVGAITTALPVGFAVAATLAGLVLPKAWSGRRRCVCGGVVCVLALVVAALAPVVETPWLLVTVLVALGLGLGVFTPANNALVMSAIPVSAAGLGGGLVNMARGMGTALGVAVVTVAAESGALAGFVTLGACAVLLTISAASG